MKLKHVFATVAFVLGFALHGAGDATAGAAIAPAQAIALGDKLDARGSEKLIEVGKRRGRSRGRRHSRHRRRDRGPSIRLYIAPPHIYGPAYKRSGRCGDWRRRCIVRWGFGTPDYDDCMRYQGC